MTSVVSNAQTPQQPTSQTKLEIAKESSVTFAEDIPQFKSKDLKDQVDEALERATQYDDTFITYLVSVNRDDPDRVFSLMEPYLQDPRIGIKFGLLAAVEQAPTRKSMSLLIRLAGDFDVGTATIMSIALNLTLITREPPQRLVRSPCRATG